jgi:DNA-binding transcriptional LysR family regulator
MNIRQLEAFRATVLVNTVSGAAVLLGVSQPSISRLIGQLERSLSVVLFDRSNGRLTLTPEGKLIYDQVERAFGAVDKIKEFAGDVQHSRVGNLSIACMPALGLDFLPSVIQEFTRLHPNVSISLDVQASAKIGGWASSQNFDLALAQMPFNRENIEVEEFCAVPHYAIVPPGHALAKRQVLTPQDFDGENFISLTRLSSARLLIDQMFESHEVDRVMGLEASYQTTICNMVGRGLGVALSDPFSLECSLPKVVPLLMTPTVEFRVDLIYPSHRKMSKLASVFVEFLKNGRDELFKRVLETVSRHREGHE